MNATFTLGRTASASWRNIACRLMLAGVFAFICALVAACGGSADAPPPPSPMAPPAPPPVLPVPPTITQQPASLTLLAGQGASFTVAATGTAPLAYQWQRNGVDIAGATTTVYTVAASVLADSGAAFRAVVTNLAGSATSNAAILTVTVAAPVLTITPQPADASVVAGTSATFTVGGICSSGTLNIQWQRSANAGASWADIAGAKATTYSLASVIGDNGAQFRAQLDCGGQSGAPSNAARLTVTAPASAALSVLLTDVLPQALIRGMRGIDQLADGSFAFTSGQQIMRLSADFNTITPIAGIFGSPGSTDGSAATATFTAPTGLTHDAAGNLYVTDYETIRRIAASDGSVSTIAGVAGATGNANGTGSAARFASPHQIALGPDGDLYVAEQAGNVIRRVTTAGVVTVYAGGFSEPAGVAVAANGDVFVGDSRNHRIQRIRRAGNVAGVIDTLAGDGTPTTVDGIGLAAGIERPSHMVVSGNTLTVRQVLGVIRQVDLTTAAVTTLTGTRTLGEYADGTKTTARIDTGFGLTSVAGGGFMVSDGTALRVVSTAGDVRSVAASDATGNTPNGTATLARIPFEPTAVPAVVVDPGGNVVVVDNSAKQLRRIAPNGAVTLIAGLYHPFPGSPLDGTGSEATFLEPGYALTVDGAGVIYAGDRYAVRKISTANVVTTLAGSALTAGATNGLGTAARFGAVFGLAVGTGGNVFVGDTVNNVVRRIDAAGNVTTYAGVVGQSVSTDGMIAAARFRYPGQLAVAPDGALYVADNTSASVIPQNAIIRRIAADGSSVSTVAGVALAGTFAVDAAGTLYYGSTAGLMQLPLGGVSSVLIPRGPGNAVVLGANPGVAGIDGIAIIGPKQLVILSGQQTLKVTLP